MLNMKIGDVFSEIPQELHYMEKTIIRICGSDSLKLGYKIFRYPRYHGYHYFVFKCLDKGDIEHSPVEYFGEYSLLKHVHYWIQYDIHKEGDKNAIA